MAKVTRLAYDNLITDAAAVIVPSSEETSLPRAALTRPLISDRWRSKTGWTIVAGENDRIPFDAGSGSDTATITAGTYATGALMAAAIVTALEAADSTPVWACSYSAVTFKFTISSDVNFQLLGATGADPTRTALFDLGFDHTSDTASALSHTGFAAAYQSRHTINVDLGSAQAFTLVALRGHNLSSGGVVRFHADASTLVGVGLDDNTTPDLSVTLSGSSDPRIQFVSSTTKRYLRIIIEDVQNSAGYAEIGVFFVGPYIAPSVNESIDFALQKEHLSEVLYAAGGAQHQVRRTRRRVWNLLWKVARTSADVALFDALDEAMSLGMPFFISFDATDAPTTSTYYGFLRAGIDERLENGSVYHLPLVFAESLG